MQGAPASADLSHALPLLVPVLAAALGALGGRLLYRRREAAQDSLTIALRGVQEATAEEIHRRIEREERAATIFELRERIRDLKEDLKRAEARRKTERAGAELLALQNERLDAQRRCDRAEIEELKERLKA